MTDVSEFQRESHRIDQLVWDAMALLRGEKVLFCGYVNDGAWVRRAAEIGVEVAVIESDEARIAQLTEHGIRTLRGSTTLIPARDASFDAVVSFHYLHEIDPTFHSQTVWELARVGKRVIVVEPAPPSDPLGKRIAELYSRAKFEAGAFEEYQPIDYWRKLLAMVKADVLMQQFTFTRLAPGFAVEQTVELILEAMAIEDLPQAYLEELRELARRPNAQLAPLSRYVLVAVAAGEGMRAGAGTLFRADAVAAAVETAPAPVPAAAAAAAAAAAVASGAPAPPPGTFASVLQDAEFPPIVPPPAAAPLPAAAPPPPPPPPAAIIPPAAPPAPAAAPPEPSFGLPVPAAGGGFGINDGAPPAPTFGLPDTTPFGRPEARPSAPFGTPFALPEDPDPFGLTDDPAQRAGFGWTWEPPEDEGEPQP